MFYYAIDQHSARVCRTGVGTHFLRMVTLKAFLLPGATYIALYFTTVRIYYTLQQGTALYQTIATSGWVKMWFRMKRVEQKISEILI